MRAFPARNRVGLTPRRPRVRDPDDMTDLGSPACGSETAGGGRVGQRRSGLAGVEIAQVEHVLACETFSRKDSTWYANRTI